MKRRIEIAPAADAVIMTMPERDGIQVMYRIMRLMCVDVRDFRRGTNKLRQRESRNTLPARYCARQGKYRIFYDIEYGAVVVKAIRRRDRAYVE